MHSFVRGRQEASQQVEPNPQINTKRQANAANAKVSTRSGSITREAQGHSAIPTRGLGNFQSNGAVVPLHPGFQQPKQNHGLKQDLYDTDIESLDTTVNRSFHQDQVHENRSGDPHQVERRNHHDEAWVSSGDEHDDNDEFETEEITEEQLREFVESNPSQLKNLPREVQLDFFAQTHTFAQRLQVVEGDSYPTTTDGNPSEWIEQQQTQQRSNDDAVAENVVRQVHPTNGHSVQAFPAPPVGRQDLPKSTPENQHPVRRADVFQQSAQFRQQPRFNTQDTLANKTAKHNTATMLTVGHRSGHNHPNVDSAAAASTQFLRSAKELKERNVLIHNAPRQLSTPAHTQQQPRMPTQMSTPPELPSPPPREDELRIHNQVSKTSSHNRPKQTRDGDYDVHRLHKMSFQTLKEEDFDCDPNAEPNGLSEEMNKKPLADRLSFVHKNLDASEQSNFFNSLPSTQWEDAGDWFIEQFKGFLERTKTARQNKRKLAQEFEGEIEKRHNHVAKKQRLINETLEDLQKQGEGLVPRGSRASRSPRPKFG